MKPCLGLIAPLVIVRIAATITGRGHGETQSQFNRWFRWPATNLTLLCILACIDALRHGEARSSGGRHDKLKIRRTEHGRRESRPHAPSRTPPLVRAPSPMSRLSSFSRGRPRTKRPSPSPPPRTPRWSSPSRSKGPTPLRSSTFGARRIIKEPEPPRMHGSIKMAPVPAQRNDKCASPSPSSTYKLHLKRVPAPNNPSRSSTYPAAKRAPRPKKIQ